MGNKTSIWLSKLTASQLTDLSELWGMKERSAVINLCVDRVWTETLKTTRLQKPTKDKKDLS